MKNICKIIVCSFILTIFLGKKAHAQDPHFSQFYIAPMQLNPGLTGLMAGDLRAVLNYRSQWGAISAPFQTMAAATDFQLLSSMTKKDVLGVGVSVLNDVAGSADLRNTQVGISVAYHKDMNGKRNNFIGIGAQYLYVQQSINFAELIFESQFNGEFLDPNQSSGENFEMNKFQYYDFTAGVSWMYRPNRFKSFYAGGAMAHLNQPKVSFLGDLQERLKMKYTIYAGADFKINRNTSFIPRAVVLIQGVAKEITAGAMVKFNVGSNRGASDRTAISFGTMHRWKDAQAIIMRYDYGDLGFSFSYDINISELNLSSKGRGAVEFALIYESDIFDERRHDKIVCPKF